MFGSKSSRDNHLVVDALIGPQVEIRGDVVFSGGLYVEGRILGKVIVEDGGNGTLTLAEQGHIEGEVRATVVVLSGRLDGDVHASERIELTPSARVTGNVHYQVVEMSAGAQLNGRLVHAAAMAALPPPEDKPAGKAKKTEASEA
ncbi:polymer-forming cytoskeletal protein [Stenotrophomonas sp. ATCM1_4]|jgi:cytoskeletal protein CcmA (bactofilin family)|uniref:Polymer-forming cytoskeletal protein n=1 Tax=Stenotrophomonas capsici TaxID=3110230 RepID=A0ABU5V1R3_9GAMM|nr:MULTISPECIES: polymer-forming cytoskeletal protein [unclassified Stenotrophomonas]MBD9535661.1 polymer-forming cytoskeletal protein [Stenotrophomonas sp. STM01]MEA5667281.1 polymer-forming cytoskeletal protein [Stenotrophomonas sp. MH1]TDB27203.1 polymer-forming cytoskeletal protein [Stenotrophomonas sp. ATCM1_4]